MEQVTEGVSNLTVTDSSDNIDNINNNNNNNNNNINNNNNNNNNFNNNKKNRIQVSNTKKPLFFYVNLAKRYMQQHNDVELSALGMAIATVVTIAEILKNNGFAVEKKIATSTVDINESGGRPVQKAKIEIVLEKSENFDELMAAAAAAAEEADAEEEQA